MRPKLTTHLVISVALCCGPAQAIDALSVVFLPRTNLDPCVTSPRVTESNYPAFVTIHDGWGQGCPENDGGNLNPWRISADGVTPLLLGNSDAFLLSADLRLSGHGGLASSIGLQVAPPWSNGFGQGCFDVNIFTGEVAVIGGRLPGFVFSEPRYSLGETIHLEVHYNPHSLTSADPATAEYTVIYQGRMYQSGPQPFQFDYPPGPGHGWGILDGSQIGGYMHVHFAGGSATSMLAEWNDITFIRTVAIVPASWSKVRALYR